MLVKNNKKQLDMTKRKLELTAYLCIYLTKSIDVAQYPSLDI
jgi:hypothetical protein